MLTGLTNFRLEQLRDENDEELRRYERLVHSRQYLAAVRHAVRAPFSITSPVRTDPDMPPERYLIWARANLAKHALETALQNDLAQVRSIFVEFSACQLAPGSFVFARYFLKEVVRKLDEAPEN